MAARSVANNGNGFFYPHWGSSGSPGSTFRTIDITRGPNGASLTLNLPVCWLDTVGQKVATTLWNRFVGIIIIGRVTACLGMTMVTLNLAFLCGIVFQSPRRVDGELNPILIDETMVDGACRNSAGLRITYIPQQTIQRGGRFNIVLAVHCLNYTAKMERFHIEGELQQSTCSGVEQILEVEMGICTGFNRVSQLGLQRMHGQPIVPAR